MLTPFPASFSPTCSISLRLLVPGFRHLGESCRHHSFHRDLSKFVRSFARTRYVPQCFPQHCMVKAAALITIGPCLDYPCLYIPWGKHWNGCFLTFCSLLLRLVSENAVFGRPYFRTRLFYSLEILWKIVPPNVEHMFLRNKEPVTKWRLDVQMSPINVW